MGVRRYPRSFWTATTVTGKNMDKAGSEAFMRLFRYISGDNELKQKIEMTVPVLASVIPGAGPFCEETFTYHFYLPAEFQLGSMGSARARESVLEARSSPPKFSCFFFSQHASALYQNLLFDL